MGPTFQTGCKATLVRNAQPDLHRKKGPDVVRALSPYMCCWGPGDLGPPGDLGGTGEEAYVGLQKATYQDRRDLEQRPGRKPGASTLPVNGILL